MTPKVMTFEEVVNYAETQIRTYKLPAELEDKHIYIRVLAQKREEGKFRQTNTNPVQIVYQILETANFLQRNKSRLEYIRAYHQLRLFGYELWIQTAKAKTAPVNVEKEIKIEITTCRRMITKISNAKARFEKNESMKLIPNWENPAYLKFQPKIEAYEERLQTALDELENFKTD